MFYFIEPEVAGGVGPNTEFHRKGDRRIVTRLNYQFDGWLGDALLETVATFIVTNELRNAIEDAGLTGISFSDVEVTRSGIFDDLYGDRELPKFWWMVVEGRPELDDFGLPVDLRLVVSGRALAVLQAAGISYAEIEPIVA